MKELPVTGGYVALLDDEDYERFKGQKWWVLKGGGGSGIYARGWDKKRKKHGMLHRQVLGLDDSNIHIDHKDGNTLNNQRDNLRVADYSQNAMNRKKRANGSSKYKGVCWDKETRKWLATAMVRGKSKKLGRFKSEEDAARAYNEHVSEHHKEFSRLNIIKL